MQDFQNGCVGSQKNPRNGDFLFSISGAVKMKGAHRKSFIAYMRQSFLGYVSNIQKTTNRQRTTSRMGLSPFLKIYPSLKMKDLLKAG